MAAPAGAGGISVPTECSAAKRDAAGFGVEAEAGLRLGGFDGELEADGFGDSDQR